jgi:hypothetical protein
MKDRKFFVVLLAACLVFGTVMSCKDIGTGNGGTGNGGTSPEPLSWMEEQIAQKWSRYHGYDDSYMYYIFRDDRTACYFEISSSGSRRDNKCYVHWELDEDNPVASNVFAVMVKTSSGGSLYFIGEYHYVLNEIWKGGYSNLDMFPSTTSRDCECD